MRSQYINRVLFGIQARSTSKRFPGKVHQKIGNRTLIECLLDSVDESIRYMRRSLNFPVEFSIALLIPEGDELSRYRTRCAIVEGDEENVLSRYYKAASLFRPDFLVRLTGDCPALPDFMISKHVRSAIFGPCDYVSNCSPGFRTVPDGWDVEVISKRLFHWIYENAKTLSDQEHVTSVLNRMTPPEWATIGHVIGHADFSNLKLSVDTKSDLEVVKLHMHKIDAMVDEAKTYRQNSIVFRL